MESQQIICILGMHRSGTSLVSRILNLLGVYLGPDEHMMRPGPDNPKGYWEHSMITVLNDDILARLGGSWHEPPAFSPGWEVSPELADLRQRAWAIIQEDFTTAKLWGWKDPRTCLTLPFWQKLLPPMRYVICLRNPVDVARSLERRNGFSFEKGVKLWLNHIISALQHTAGQPRIFVFYEDLMEDWLYEARRLAGFLGKRELIEQEAIQQAIKEFIEEELQHHRTSIIDTADEPKLSFPAKALYIILRTYVTRQCAGRDIEDASLQKALDVLGSHTLEASAEQEHLAQLVAGLREQVTHLEQQLEICTHQIQGLQAQLGEKEQQAQQLQSQLSSLQQRLSWKRYRIVDRLLGYWWHSKQTWQQVKVYTWKLWRKLYLRLYGQQLVTSLTDKRLHLYGYLDKIQIDINRIVLIGWIFHESQEILGISLIVQSSEKQERFVGRYGQERQDVYRSFPCEHSRNSGFWIKAIPTQKGAVTLALEVQFRDNTHHKILLGRIKIHSASFLNRLLQAISLISKQNIKAALRHIRNGNWRYLVNRLKMELKIPDHQSRDAYLLNSVLSLVHQDPPQPEPLGEEIDIIIPVYNGLEYLDRLFQSIFKNTRAPYRLIIIDDCSSDPNIWPYLSKIAQEHHNTILLRNQINKGFPATVNLGLRHAHNHCVVLNTDVEVPPFWLERLMRPIINNPTQVATTTPFTNSGTVCSFPKFLEDNDIHRIFDGLSTAEIDWFFRQLEPEEITLPSAVGFCMGINKYAIQTIGFFDEETFGRGYGEENDWCMRASYKGYKHVMVTNLFVYHKHGATFGEEKRKLMERNLALLVKKHPEYPTLVEKHIMEDPAGPIRSFLFLLIACNRNTILILDHELGGGANLYRNELIRERLAQQQAVLLYTENLSELRPLLRCYYKDYVVEFGVSNPEELLQLASLISLTEIFYNNIVSYSDPLLMTDLLIELKRLSRACFTIAIHDFYPVCPSYILIDKDGVFCGIPSIMRCKECLPFNKFVGVPSAHVDIEAWRRKWHDCLTEADTILCFSQSSADLVRRAYPNLDSKKFVIRPHQLKPETLRIPRINFSTEELRIGVVGSINYAKGSHIVQELARLIKDRGLSAKIYIIGSFTGEVLAEVVTVTGPYRREDLPSIIEKLGVNVFLLPSICPETFSYVTEELIHMQVPLAVFDLGAPAERVRQYAYGKVIPQINAEAALEALIALFRDMKDQRG